MPPPLLVHFAGGASGDWRVDRMTTCRGDMLPAVAAVIMTQGAAPAGATWVLRGTTSNTRYAERAEVASLAAVQQGLARPAATRAALIPIRKTEAWWALAQDERRAILETRSRHISIGLEYLPAVARRLHHCRELHEAFDFVTWFEYAPEHEAGFDEMLRRLREREEWDYIDREIDIRLVRREA